MILPPAARLGGSGVGVLTVTRWPGLQSSEGLTEAGRSVSKMAHSRVWHIGVGCWQEVLILPCVDLPLLMVDDFP